MNRNCIDSNQNITIYVFTIIIFTGIYLFTLSSFRINKNNIKSKLIKKINKLENDYRALVNKHKSKIIYPKSIPLVTNPPPFYPQQYNGIDHVDNRDRNVVNDELYPPISRTERPVFDNLLTSLSSGAFAYPTRGFPDTYRPLGLAKSEKSQQMFLLMGRQKYPGSSIGEFYLMSTDKTNQIKIPLDRQHIKDYYNIPNEIKFNDKDSIMGNDVIKVQEYKKSDLDSPYI
jgi:hypothetical protein